MLAKKTSARLLPHTSRGISKIFTLCKFIKDYKEKGNIDKMDERLTAIIIKGKVHRLTAMPDNEPCLCKKCSLQELCDRLNEHILCDFIGDFIKNHRGHSMFKCDDK